MPLEDQPVLVVGVQGAGCRPAAVAAMANTRGGLIIFGVRDATCELVGIDPTK
ncbi:RNA-binding domain-containing protein [Streptomyces sp. INA 01156]